MLKPTFEDSILCIDKEINKRRGKWNLTALSWMDFDDVSQILRIHIFKKWEQYDHTKPLVLWINKIISNQIKNLRRNNYSNYARPCLNCAAAEGVELCSLYKKQCNDCPLYAHWEKTRKRAYNIKLPLPLENHAQEVFNIENESLDIQKSAEKIHEKMITVLKPIEWRVYKYLYIDGLQESQIANFMGYKTSEKNRSPGYKQIKNIKKSILSKVKKALYGGEIDIV